MKIYFLIEIALLLAACITAIIVTIKNVKLRKKLADKEKSIADLSEIIYQDMRKRVSLENERDRLKLEHENLKNGLVIISSSLPDRKEKESDAHFNQRCRQSVANRCAKYVKVADQITLKVIK